MMIPDKSQVSDQACEVFPAWERFRIDHDPMQLAVCFDVGVDFLGQPLEIGLIREGPQA